MTQWYIIMDKAQYSLASVTQRLAKRVSILVKLVIIAVRVTQKIRSLIAERGMGAGDALVPLVRFANVAELQEVHANAHKPDLPKMKQIGLVHASYFPRPLSAIAGKGK